MNGNSNPPPECTNCGSREAKGCTRFRGGAIIYNFSLPDGGTLHYEEPVQFLPYDMARELCGGRLYFKRYRGEVLIPEATEA